MITTTDLHDRFFIDGGYWIDMKYDTKSFREHTHDFLEIVYVFKGRGVHYVDGREYPTDPGDALFINYGSTHRFEIFSGMNYANVIVKPEFISESLKGAENAFALLELDSYKEFAGILNRNAPDIHFSAGERRQMENLILLAYAEQESNRPGKELMLHSLFNTILTLVFRKMALPLRKDVPVGADLLSYIKTNCAAPLTLEGIATEHHYNPAYFSRLFKKRTGVNFTEYLTSCRVSMACRLLRETEMSVGDIALEVGFSDRTKFFRVFAREMGTTPLKYRKSKK